MKIEPDDFAIWRDNPVTQALFAMLADDANEAKEIWLAHSWDAGLADVRKLYEMRARAHVCAMVINVEYRHLFEGMDSPEEMEAELEPQRN